MESSNGKRENPNVKAQMTNEIQMSKLKIQMKMTDNGHGHGTRTLSEREFGKGALSANQRFFR
jgi:hypothetical protein